MSGPGFANIRTFSRVGNKAGQSVDQVLGEAERDPQYSSHVDQPKPPELIFGMTVDEVRQAHAALLVKRKTKVRVQGEVKERAIRKDRHTLAGCVMSYPVLREQVMADGDEWQRYLEWRELNLHWLKKLWGDNLKSVIQHDDEPYLHLHALGLPESDAGCDARTMNPAYMMKRLVLEQEKAVGKSNKEALKIANRAYRAEGRKLQDGYHAAVGIPSGLTRFGPRRRRLTRAQWHEEKERARASSDHNLQADLREIIRQRASLNSEVENLTAKKSDLTIQLDQIKAVSRGILDQATSSAKQITAAAQSEQEKTAQEAERFRSDRHEFEAESVRLKQELDLRNVALTKRERQSELILNNVAYAVENLEKAVNTAIFQRSGEKITAKHMEAGQFGNLCKVLGKDDPTRLDWLRVWSLYAPSTGFTLAIPERVVVALEGAFKKIEDFSIKIGQLREEARLKGIEEAQISALRIVEAARLTAADTEKSASNSADSLLSDAKAQSKTIIAAAERHASTINADAACIMDQARETKAQADETLRAAETEATRLVQQEVRNRRLEPQARAWAAFARLLKEGVKAVFGEAGYQRLADWINPRWSAHPDNPERPIERQPAQTVSRGPAP